KEFSRTNRVFYIEHPYSIKDFISLRKTEEIRKRRKALMGNGDQYVNPYADYPQLTVVYPPLTYPVNFLPDGSLYNYFSGINDKKIFNVIRSVLRDFQVSKWIYFNSYDPFFARKFPDDLKPDLKIYQSMDDISQEPYTAKHGLRLEED